MARARVNEYVRKFLYTGDSAVLEMVRDSTVSGSWRETARVLRDAPASAPPEVAYPPLGHEVTTCCPSECCANLAEYLDRDTGCAVVAATRACAGGHSDFAWNTMETFSGHDPHVVLLRQVYTRVPHEDLVKCAALVCRGAVRFARGPETGQKQSDLDYLRIVPKAERRKPARARDLDRRSPLEPEVKGVTIDSWRESEQTVRVVLQ